MNKKGMTMALTLIVAAVVLIVIGLLIITITSGSLTNFINSITDQEGSTSCDIKVQNYCITHQGEPVGSGKWTINDKACPEFDYTCPGEMKETSSE